MLVLGHVAVAHHHQIEAQPQLLPGIGPLGLEQALGAPPGLLGAARQATQQGPGPLGSRQAQGQIEGLAAQQAVVGPVAPLPHGLVPVAGQHLEAIDLEGQPLVHTDAQIPSQLGPKREVVVAQQQVYGHPPTHQAVQGRHRGQVGGKDPGQGPPAVEGVAQQHQPIRLDGVEESHQPILDRIVDGVDVGIRQQDHAHGRKPIDHGRSAHYGAAMTAPEAPLADRMRPRSLDEVLGQEHLAGPAGLLRQLGDGPLPSVIFQGPPGTGKTTLARLFAGGSGARFRQLSAVLSGVADLRREVREAEVAREGLERRVTVLFVDEIHRWNKAQQDALLPHVEAGTVTLLGATTENPGFYIIPALRSRCRIARLEPLGPEHVHALLERALADTERGLGSLAIGMEPDALEALAGAADGDARRALSLLEDVARRVDPGSTVDLERLSTLVQAAELRHDRDGDAHYDVLSAFIKAMRGSDPDAGIYWLARLLAGGEPPEAVARRVVIFAAEDVGNADPRALQVAVAAAQAVQLTGMPEARIPLAQAVTYCATAPKSNAAYRAIDAALERVKATGSLPVPLHLRNAPTQLAKQAGHGAGYRYPHDHPHHIVTQQYLPEQLAGEVYYRPAPHGNEKTIAERLAWWAQQLDKREDEAR